MIQLMIQLIHLTSMSVIGLIGDSETFINLRNNFCNSKLLLQH